MSEILSRKKSRQLVVARAKEEYQAAVAAAAAARETAFKQAAADERAVIEDARSLLAQSQAVVDDAADSVERRLRQADMEKLRLEQTKRVTEAAQKRKRAETDARSAEKEALRQAEVNLKTAVAQAMNAEIGNPPDVKTPETPPVDNILVNGTPPLREPQEDTVAVAAVSNPAGNERIQTLTNELERLHQSLMELVSETDISTPPVPDMSKTDESILPPAVIQPPPEFKPDFDNRPAEDAPVISDQPAPIELKSGPDGRIKVTISRIASTAQLVGIERAVREWAGVKLIMTTGDGSGAVFYVSSEDPLSLPGRFRALPIVEEAIAVKGELSVKLKPVTR